MTQLSPLLAQVLINRGIKTAEAAQTFLNPEAQLLPSPIEEFPDLTIALELLMWAIATQQRIAICGDYDADGMTSTALLMRSLKFLGADIDYAIPSRMQEGYGINQRIVEEFHEEGVKLVLTVDNGIAAYEPIARARELGLIVIVTDHHDIPEQLPPANAILNPKLIHEESPYRGVAGVGVAYILAVCLAQCLKKTQDLTTPLIELFTLGTIADLAPLTGVNRRWVKRGLKLLPKSKLTGIRALIQVAGLSNEKALKPEAIGFRLGPRINAVGRISDPQMVIELLTTDDEGRSLELAMACEQVNQLRQQLCEQIEQEAIAWCEQSQFEPQRDRVLVVVQPDWHHGVIGIVASRLVERYGVPVFIGTYEDDEREKIRGSARSIPEFHVFEALQFCGNVLERFGGHRAAGGFSMKAANLDEWRSRLQLYASHQLQPEHLKPLVSVDVQADLSQLNLSLYEQIDALHPCGIENPDPIFWTPNLRVVDQQTIGREQAHLKLTVTQDGQTQGKKMKAIAWRWGEYYPLPERLDAAYRLRLNEWNGEKNVELELVGIRLPEGSDLPPVLPHRTEGNGTGGSGNVGNGNGATSAVSPAQALSRKLTEAFSRKQQPHSNNPESLIRYTIESHIHREAQYTIEPLDPAVPSGFFQPANENSTDLDSEADSESDEADSALPNQVEFYYSKRKYSCIISRTSDFKELRIKNSEGQVLAVQPRQRIGLLGKRREEAKEVDVSLPHYFNLIRAALSALELSEKSQLIQGKDQLLIEKNRQIETLHQQVELLNQELSQLSSEQQHQFQTLQADLQAREAAIQAHESHIARLQTELSHSTQLDLEHIRRQVKSKVGELIWSSLDQRSQKDLYFAYKNHEIIRSEGFTAQIADYSEAGLRLGFAVEREIIHPFFKSLHQFLLTNGGSDEIGGVVLGNRKKYTLGMLPPLIAAQWYSFRDDALKRSSESEDDDLYCMVSFGKQVSQSDRQKLTTFLTRWKHPLAEWFNAGAIAAASAIDQINKLRNIAAHAESSLYQWQFEILDALVIGSETKNGIFREIYSKNQK
ncbi:single-stranded-DNA-specific exonuclease RecJ [Leptolyngbya sp. FACHB-671]|nr:single-stranded-DNA-specific exonuclease RecJ [Leptolyngbya sp. FACHB-671]MBD2072063.1 single-stranded-DNA-specific exonuclease RecJ [Leptolyngbya sp. FACHB-671]